MKMTRKIRDNLLIKEIEDRAKKVEREDLEELYVQSSYLDESTEYVSHWWSLIAIIACVGFLLVCLALYMTGATYENTESDNYNALSQELCALQGYDEYKYFTVKNAEFRIKCDNEFLHLPVG